MAAPFLFVSQVLEQTQPNPLILVSRWRYHRWHLMSGAVAMYIQLTDQVPVDQWHHLMEWREWVFPEEGRGMEWSPPVWHLLAFTSENAAMNGEMPVGKISFSRFVIEVDGQAIPVVGVGGVVIRPEYQGKGVPALIFARLHQQAPTIIGTNIFTLFCPARLVNYYRKHGYQLCERPVTFIQHGESVLSTFAFMSLGELPGQAGIQIPSAPW